jgi:hypothetical protein
MHPEARRKIGVCCSKILRLAESPRGDLIGQVMATTEWSEILGISSNAITSSTSCNRGWKAGGLHKFKVVVDDVLLDGEEEFEHEIYGSDGESLVAYKITSFGRIWRADALRWCCSEYYCIKRRKWGAWQLAMLAKTGERAIPEGMTVDHINGRGGEWPHRMSNLRWADARMQLLNREALPPRSASPAPESSAEHDIDMVHGQASARE